ncbi:alpha/beta fold hydrolase [Halodesulfovibrio marinisediminis]|uniref:Alpha/beta hydrolase family protein n=1 Tax=Halodesulfovibrio marinisediminis DSM 17456 TaxID=1121457 RepID=A0A1N6FUC7_9BACT|nr:hypothetical protein [Halodesulfovibrio marinisediminis]SIN98771.1 hypothetical protein SAMN02745161_1514 [Halodesulfovibrio marinisediminis DSM 17456]
METTPFVKKIIRTLRYDIVAYTKYGVSKDIVIYIEGDGRAWYTSSRPSSDPTPVPPLALALAIKDPAENVVYLARPCQFTGGIDARNCDTNVWTFARMSDEVIISMDEAISTAKQQSGAKNIHLVGYSGGGGIAILIAARRDDIASIRTIAGNINTQLWTDLHDITPLYDSISPENYAHKISHIPQVHYVGAEDKNIPSSIARSFGNRSKADSLRIITVPKCSHTKGWETAWSTLLQQYASTISID